MLANLTKNDKRKLTIKTIYTSILLLKYTSITAKHVAVVDVLVFNDSKKGQFPIIWHPNGVCAICTKEVGMR